MPDSIERLIGHSVFVCPQCGKRHDYALVVKRSDEATLLFGGGTSDVEISLRCPETGAPITSHVALSNNEEFVRVADPGSGTTLGTSTGAAAAVTVAGALSSQAAAPALSDFDEWVKTSRATAHSFATTMLTTASAAIPVYFAVLKYLGVDKVVDTPSGGLSLLPPLLFLLSVAMVAIGLRPRLAAVTPDQFPAFRADRLHRLDRYLTAALACFVLALLLALLAFAIALLA